MKRTICIMVMLSGMISARCQTPVEKTNALKAKFEQAKINLQQARTELNASYPAYKQDAKDQIKVNEKKIEELRAHFVMPKTSSLNDESKKKIDALENINIELRDRLYIVDE